MMVWFPPLIRSCDKVMSIWVHFETLKVFEHYINVSVLWLQSPFSFLVVWMYLLWPYILRFARAGVSNFSTVSCQSSPVGAWSSTKTGPPTHFSHELYLLPWNRHSWFLLVIDQSRVDVASTGPRTLRHGPKRLSWAFFVLCFVAGLKSFLFPSFPRCYTGKRDAFRPRCGCIPNS